jgi:3-hydroxyisobutyrate dehydrogenase-like beta-hydroxyacid dehydrogenase
MADAAQPGAPVAVVGLGNMGRAIAERLLDDGYALSVFNRTPGRGGELAARGASTLGAASEALTLADVCITSLSDDDAVDAVLLAGDGILAHARAGTTLVDTSTSGVGASRRIADAAAAAGVDYLRAPVSGNPDAIRSGKAAIFVSGPADAASRVEPMLETIAPTVRYAGEGELARVLKLVLQVLIGGTAELLAEAIVLGEAAGLDRGTVLDTIAASVVGSTFVGYKTEPLLARDYSATFTTKMMLKDVDLVLDLADENAVELPVTAELRAVLEDACGAGHADDDFISLVQRLEDRKQERE